MSRLVIDPVTRVGGHLRVEAELANGAVSDAWVSGTMYRGLEAVLVGRDPRDAWLLAQRVCGSCTGVHALASVRAVENALGITVPTNARLIRNLLAGSSFVQDHIAQFYLHEAPDWIDPVAALGADAAATSVLARSMSDWANSSAAYFQAARDRLAALVESGPFANAYAGHPALRVPGELSLLVLAHYLEALDRLRQIVRLQTILGGKSPHPQTYLVGGMAVAPEWGGPSRPAQGEHPWRAARHSPPPLSADGLAEMAALIRETSAFVSGVLVPDVLAVAAHYPEWESIGRAHGHFMSFGEFPVHDTGWAALLLPDGRVMDRDLRAVGQVDQAGVGETVIHSWYDDVAGALVHPSAAHASPLYSGPRPPFSTLDGHDRYSWLKAPRYNDDPMEVGPLARLLVGYAAGAGDARTAADRIAGQLNTGIDGIYGTLGRSAARALEAQSISVRMGEWLRELVANLASGDLSVIDLSRWEPSHWPSQATGFGLAEGPRGTVGHWLTLRDGRIADYQIVDGSTWNGSPRDGRGRRGACEEALIGTPVADANRPLEILRTVHSFAICPACAVH